LLDKYCESARVLAGGTDLLVDLKQDRVTGVEHLISLQDIPGLGQIDGHPGGLSIGAMVVPNQAARDNRITCRHPALVDAINSMAAYPVRNMATIVGNLASAVPSSDLAPFFKAMDSGLVLSNGLSERKVNVRDYFLAPRRGVCGLGEIITHIDLADPLPNQGASYQKFALRGSNALAVTGVAAMLRLGVTGEIADACVVLGAVAPVPDVAGRTNSFLVHKRPEEPVFAEAARLARSEARPISDVRGSREYRQELVEVLARRALAEAYTRALKGGG